jgi:hypothetical protein
MRTTTLCALAALLLVPAAAGAQTYPEPKEPGRVAAKPKGPFATHTVCKQRGRCDFRTIQAAVNAADAGDKVAVKPGVYRESVRIAGRGKRYLRLVGNPRKPGRVVLDGRKRMQNGVFVQGADQVTVNGFTARDYKANGFFLTSVVGYKLTNLVAARTGVYGMFAFNSKGGEMSHSEAYYVNDAGFYIGQTPPQANPMRSIVRDIDSWGNPIGWSGTNMRYVTITRSRFYNNAVGVAPNALDSEKFPPEEDNAIVDNDIFWNNFNFYEGAPFEPRTEGVAAIAPVGTGLILLGGRRTRVEGNRVYGNHLAGVVAVEGIFLDRTRDARALLGNRIAGNEFGLGGEDLNARDLAYDGNGTGNCWGPNTGVRETFPADPAFFPACPFTGANAFSQDQQNTMLSWAGRNSLQNQVKHPHKAKPGYTPLELYRP